MGARSTARSLRDAPAAATVTARHLLRGTAHVAGLPRPWQTSPAYARALEAYRDGDLRHARDLAHAAGPAGRLLARLVDGELALLLQPAPPARRIAPDREAGRDADRVLHLVTNAQPETVAGYTVRTRGITEAQRAAGLDVHVVSRLGFPVNKGRIGAAVRTEVGGVPHHRLLPLHLPLRADEAFRADVERSSRLVEQVRPGVLHAHSNHVNGQVGLALRARHGIPLVYEVRGLLEETWLSRTTRPEAAASDFYRLTREAEGRVMRGADAVVTLSASLREAVIERGVAPERVHVVPNCVDADWLAAEPVPRRDAGAPLTVGIGGTLNAYEGVDVLVEAVALLRERGADVRLLVAGDGPVLPALRELAQARGLGEAATFTGRLRRPELMAAYRELDVFCLPRRDLSVTRLVPPLKPVEAMAMGLPVVGSDLAPLREMLGEDRGVLVHPDDPAALAAALHDLVDPDLRARIGGTARTWVARTRTWAAATETYRTLYASIQGETP